MLLFVFRQLAAVQFRLLLDDRQFFFRTNQLVLQIANVRLQTIDFDQLGLVLIGIDAVFGLRRVDLRFGHETAGERNHTGRRDKAMKSPSALHDSTPLASASWRNR